MASRTIGCLLLTIGVAAALVEFHSSQVFDEFDFKGQSTLTIDCYDGCAIFASVTNESDYLAKNLLIQLPKGFISVSEVAGRIDATTKQKSPLIVKDARRNALKIVNGNSQLAAGPLVLYVVKGDEAKSPSADVFEAEGLVIENVPKALTVMSARPFTLHQEPRQGQAAAVPDGVGAVMGGYDGLGATGPTTCWPLYFTATLQNHFYGIHFEVNGPIVTFYYDKSTDFGVPLPPITGSLGISNMLNFNMSGWVGSPGAHSCAGQPLYRSSLYDLSAPIHAEILSDKPIEFRALYATSTEGLRLTNTDNGVSKNVHATDPHHGPDQLQFFNTKHVSVDWTPDGSDDDYFIVQWTPKQY